MSHDARTSLGVTGRGVDGSLAEAVAAGPGLRPLLGLGALGGGLLAQGTALLLAPDIGLSLGRTTTNIGTLLGLWSLGVVLGVPFALRAVRGERRIRACAVSASGTACGLVLVAMAAGPRSLALGAVMAGLGSAVCMATQRGLLADLYPPLSLAHALAAYRATVLLSASLTLVVAQPATHLLGLSWRVGLLMVAAALVGAAAFTSAVDEPSVAGFEKAVALRVAGATASADSTPTMSFGESVRRLLSISSVRPLLAMYALAALLGFGTVVYGGYAVTQRTVIPASALPGVLALAGVVAAVVILDRAGQLARSSRLACSSLARQGAIGFAATGGGIALAGLSTWAPACLLGIVAAAAGLALAVSAVDRMVVLVVPPALRGSAGALACAYEALLGIALGGAILSGLESSQGLHRALPVLGAVGIAGALVLRVVGRQADKDLDASARALTESAMFAARRDRAPLLTCRGIDFSYGPLQILFDVNFTVDEGEMVALLGTNGAGKSTLLRVIAGLGTPSAGTVRLSGRDITFAEPGERVRSGISQIPGGKAVFGPLSVAENLRLYGYSLGRDKKAVDRGIEEAFGTFPRLQERRNSPASTMSGGEQQMLALSKALILQPKLLLIDELSLGLAPKVVGELLVLVRSINAQGAAVVLVEQSVHVALSLAEHAYFMEKGQVRFDGRTADLLERPDILRSVFLSGATQGQAS